MASKPSDTAILDLGNIGEENAFSSSITPSAGNLSSTVHSFEDKVPDSALDTDEGNPKVIISLTCLSTVLITKRFFKIFLCFYPKLTSLKVFKVVPTLLVFSMEPVPNKLTTTFGHFHFMHSSLMLTPKMSRKGKTNTQIFNNKIDTIF